MSLENLKITDSKINQNGVASAPDKLTGSAAQNKEVFDNLVRKIVAKSINDVIDTLTSSAGAQSIGMNDLYGEQEGLTVFTAVEKMCLKTNADKSDKIVTDNHIKNVEHDEKTGIFKFIRENGEEIIIDTALEKISVNFSYDSDNESILIYLADGTTESVPLSSFISETDWNESDTVQFNVEQHKVSAFIKYGSITDEHLSSLLRNTLITYVTESGNSAVVAQNAADSATESASKAEKSAEYSELCAQQSQESSNYALEYEIQAEKHAMLAENSQKNAEQYASEAKTARDEAVEISGFDPTNYVRKTDIATIGSSAGLVKLPEDTSRGLYVTPSGELRVYGGTDGAVRGTSRYSPICADQLPYAVKVGLLKCSGMNSIDTGNALNNTQKTAIANWLGSARIETGEYTGTGIDDNGQTEISFAVGFSPSIVVINKISDNEDICTAILFKSMAPKGIYSVFSNSQISQSTADSIYFATDDTDMNFRITDNGGNVTFCMGGASYSYVVIG